MSTDGNEVTISPMKRYLGIVCVIMLAAIGIGLFINWGEGESGHLMPAIWIGFAVSVVYLLSQIASNIEKHRMDT